MAYIRPMKQSLSRWVVLTGILLAALCTFFAHGVQAQPGEDPRRVITTVNNQTYVGIIVSDDGREVLIETELLGKIYILKSDIRSIQPLERSQDVQNGEFVGAGAFTTRYAFTTNALPVRKGENYALLQLYGPEVHFALTDRLNLGIMSTWIGSPMVLAAKYSMPTSDPMLNFSVGGLVGTSGYLNNFEGSGGLYFGNATYGDRNHNVTFAVGYAHLSPGLSNEMLVEKGTYFSTWDYFDPYNPEFSEGRIEASQRNTARGPLFSIAAVTKVGPKASLVFDSMFGSFRSNNRYNEATTTELVPPYYDPITGYLITPGQYQHDVRLVDGDTEPVFMFLLMPGFRVERTEKKAFQFNLAGVSFKSEGVRYSFPFPMCTWFYSF